MADAASSNVIPAFPTTALASLNSNAAAIGSLLASTEYGCPESDFISLGSKCAFQSKLPACITSYITAAEAGNTAATIDYDAACCTSISIYAVSLESCFEKSAPACLNTADLLASATAPGNLASFTTMSNPCAQYFGGAKVGGATPKPTSTPKAATGATVTAGGSTATGTSSGGSTAATKASAATKVGSTGLKVYLGLGLVGALAVLAM